MESLPGPVYLCSSLDPVTCVFVVRSPLNASFVATLQRLCPAPVEVIDNDPAHPSDLWMQDTVEFCQALSSEGSQTPVALLGLRARHDQGLVCGPLDQRVATHLSGSFPSLRLLRLGAPLPDRRWIDWFGNLEVSPPIDGFPHGRILTGRQGELTLHADVLAFLEKQAVQWPPVVLDVSWLTIGHIDELIQGIPARNARGWKVLLPSPSLAAQILATRPDHEMVFAGTPGATTVGRLRTLAAAQETRTIEASLARTRTTLAAELGIQDEDILPVPALFEKGLALIPNAVNSLVVNQTIFVPDPGWGPFADAIREPLEAQGLIVHLLDIWEPYHIRAGEIHCATNALRRLRTPSWQR